MSDPQKTLDQLQLEVEKLLELLKNREVGLSIWWEFLLQRFVNIKTIMGEYKKDA